MSMTLLEQMKSSISPQSTGYAAKLLGESQTKIDNAVALAVPAILSAMTSAAHVPAGTGAQSMISRHVSDPVNDGSLLHRLPALYQGTMTAAPIYRLGNQVLQTVFGSNLGTFTQAIASSAGIKPASAATLVNTITPHILAVVGKRHRLCGDPTPHGLQNLLDTEKSKLLAALPESLARLTATATGPAAVASATIATKPTASAAAPATSAAKATDKSTGKSSVKPAAAVDIVHTTVPKHQPHVAKPAVAQPVVVKQSYRWNSWLPILAIYGAGAAGIAMIMTAQSPTPTGTVPTPASEQIKTAAATPASPAVPAPPAPAPATVAAPAAPPVSAAPVVSPKPKSAEATDKKATDTKPAETKVAEAKASDKKPAAPTAPVTAPATASATVPIPMKTAEIPKPAEAAKTADVAKPTAAAKSAEAVKPVEPTKPVEPAKTVEAAKPAEPAKPAPPAAAPTVKAPVEQQDVSAQANPYKPPVAITRPVALPIPAAKAAVVAAATAAADAAAKPAPPAPAQQTIVVQPPPAKGVTSYFGITPRDVEAPARPNPDYKPTTPPADPKPEVATAPAAATPSAEPAPAPAPASVKATVPPGPSLAEQAISAVKELITPTPPRPAGITSYFGNTPAQPEVPARPNPDYKPASPPAAQAAATPPPASGATPASGGSDAVLACRTALKKASRGGRIAFQSSKADLRNSSIAMLNRIAAALNSCSAVRVTVEGHTDNTGRAESNQALSLSRAKTVADYLAAKGVDASRISAVGMGATRPVAPNTSALNKALNRRIEFTVGNS